MTERNFVDLVQQALRLTQTPIWLDQIIDGHYLVSFEDAPGLFVVASKPSSPRQLAVQLAIRQIECDAFRSFCLGFEQAKTMRLQDMAPPTGVMQ